MSKQNKVNPGMYTQAGRLTPDDTAREMKKQRGLSSSAKAEPQKPAKNRVTKKDNADEEEEPEDSVEE